MSKHWGRGYSQASQTQEDAHSSVAVHTSLSELIIAKGLVGVRIRGSEICSCVLHMWEKKKRGRVSARGKVACDVLFPAVVYSSTESSSWSLAKDTHIHSYTYTNYVIPADGFGVFCHTAGSQHVTAQYITLLNTGKCCSPFTYLNNK